LCKDAKEKILAALRLRVNLPLPKWKQKNIADQSKNKIKRKSNDFKGKKN
jgi:hypothetical protein